MSHCFKETTISLSLQNSETIGFFSNTVSSQDVCLVMGKEGKGQLFLWMRKQRKVVVVGIANFNCGLHTWALVVSQG